MNIFMRVVSGFRSFTQTRTLTARRACAMLSAVVLGLGLLGSAGVASAQAFTFAETSLTFILGSGTNHVAVDTSVSFGLNRALKAGITFPEASGGGVANVNYTLEGLPVGLAFDPATRVLSGTPTETLNQHHLQVASENGDVAKVTYKAVDSSDASNVVTQAYTMEINGPGFNEYITKKPSRSGRSNNYTVEAKTQGNISMLQGQASTFELRGMYRGTSKIRFESHLPQVQYSLTGLPAGLSFDDTVGFYGSATGGYPNYIPAAADISKRTISGTPTATGTYPLTYFATQVDALDSSRTTGSGKPYGISKQQVFNLVVGTAALTYSLPDLTYKQGEDLPTDGVTLGSSTGGAGQTRTYSPGSTLPTGMTFSGGGGTLTAGSPEEPLKLSGTPNITFTTFPQTFPMTVNAGFKGGGTTTSAMFDIVISDPGLVFRQPPLTFTQNVSIGLGTDFVSPSGGTPPYEFTFFDLPGIYDIQEGANLIISTSSGSITGKPRVYDRTLPTTFTLTAHISDGASPRASITAPFDIVILPTVSGSSNNATFVSVQSGGVVTEGRSPATFTLTLTERPSAPLTITYEVTETSSGSSDFVASVDEGMKTVTVAIGEGSVKVEVPTQANTVPDISGSVMVTVTDGDGYTPSPGIMRRTNTGSRTVSGTGASSTITILDDGVDLFGFRQTSLADIFAGQVVTFGTSGDTGGPTISFGLNLPLAYKGADANITQVVLPEAAGGGATSVAYTLTGQTLPTGLDFNAATRVLSGTPTVPAKQGGAGTITKFTYTATSTPSNATVGLTFALRIDGPRMKDTYPNLTFGQNMVVNRLLDFTDVRSYDVSPDTPKLSFTLTGLPPGLLFDNAADDARTIVGTPTQLGTSRVTYTATQKSAPYGVSASREFNIAVAGPPVATISSDTTELIEPAGPTTGSIATVTVELGYAPSAQLALSYRVSDTTAAATFLASAASGVTVLTYMPGERQKTFMLAVVGDNVAEEDGTITVELLAGSGYSIGAPTSLVIDVRDNDDNAKRVVTGSGGICSRTDSIQQAILKRINPYSRDCVDITRAHLNGISGGMPYFSGAGQLSLGDFDGLIGVTSIAEENGGITGTLVTGLFSPMINLETLNLANNRFTAIEAGAFDGLSKLTTLNISNSQGTTRTLAAGALRGLSKVTTLYAGGAGIDLNALPSGIFADFPTPRNFQLGSNPGAPLTFTVQLRRVGSNAVRLSSELPLLTTLTFPISADGGATPASADLVIGSDAHTSAAETITSASPSAASTISLGALPTLPSVYTGVALKAGTDVTLFATAASGASVASIADGATVGEGTNAEFTVTLSPAAPSAFSLNYTVTDAAASNFVASGEELGAVSVAAGATSVTILVPTVNDSVDETSGDITVTLRDSSAASPAYTVSTTAGASTATAMITDDDTPTATVFGGLPVTEGANVEFTVQLSPAANSIVTFTYTVDDAPGANFIRSSYSTRTVAFAAGETLKTISVPTDDDSGANASEPSGDVTLTLTMSSDTNVAMIGAAPNNSATVRVNDNDAPIPLASISNGGTITEGGTAVFNVAFTIPLTSDIMLAYSVADASPADFVEAANESGTVSVATGARTATIRVPTLNDRVDEPNGAITVTLGGGSGYGVGAPRSATATINDNDIPTGLVFATDDVNQTYTAGGSDVTLTLSQAVGKAVAGNTVAYTLTLADGSASSPFASLSGRVLTISLSSATPGVTTLRYTATESGSLSRSISKNFTVTVFARPTFASGATITASGGAGVSFANNGATVAVKSGGANIFAPAGGAISGLVLPEITNSADVGTVVYALSLVSTTASSATTFAPTFNPTTRTLSGTSDLDDVGVYELTYTASNAAGTATSFAITLTLDQSPDFVSPIVNRTYSTGADIGSLILPEATFTGGSVVYALSVSQSVADVPLAMLGLAFSPTSRTLSGTLGREVTTGLYNFTYTASGLIGSRDAMTEARQVFTVNILDELVFLPTQAQDMEAEIGVPAVQQAGVMLAGGVLLPNAEGGLAGLSFTTSLSFVYTLEVRKDSGASMDLSMGAYGMSFKNTPPRMLTGTPNMGGFYEFTYTAALPPNANSIGGGSGGLQVRYVTAARKSSKSAKFSMVVLQSGVALPTLAANAVNVARNLRIAQERHITNLNNHFKPMVPKSKLSYSVTSMSPDITATVSGSDLFLQAKQNSKPTTTSMQVVVSAGLDRVATAALAMATFNVNILPPSALAVGDSPARVNRTVAPVIVREMVGQAMSAISQRLGQIRSGNSALAASLGGHDSLATVFAHNAQAFNSGERELKDLLAGSNFGMPLGDVSLPQGSASNIPTLNASGSNDGFASLYFWGSSDYHEPVGEDNNINWSGEIISLNLGIDARIHRTLRNGEIRNIVIGNAITWSEADLDYKDSSDPVISRGRYDLDLTTISPYAAWTLDAGNTELDMWATVGFGDGEITIATRSAAQSGRITANTSLRNIGVGASGHMWEGHLWAGEPWEQEALTKVRLKTEINHTSLEISGASGTGVSIAAVETSTNRVRIILEGKQSYAQADGSRVDPSIEIGIRRDGRAGDTGAALEVSAGLRVVDPASGVVAEGNVRSLNTLLGSGEYNEWGVSGMLRFAASGNGRGWSFSLSPTYGDTSSDIQQMWNQGIPEAGGATTDYSMHVDSRVGYGLISPIGKGLLTPYTELSLNSDARTYRAGTNWKLNRLFDLTLTGERQEQDSVVEDDRVVLKGRLNF